MHARITGEVLKVDRRELGSGERVFRFREVFVRSGMVSITPVRFTEDYAGDVPRAGDSVDLEVKVGGYNGRNGLELSAQAVGDFVPVQGVRSVPSPGAPAKTA